VEARFSAPVQTGPEAHPVSYIMGIGFLLGVKRPGRGIDHPSHLAPRLKKEKSYTCTPPLSLRGLFKGEIYLHLYLYYVTGQDLEKSRGEKNVFCRKYTIYHLAF
jgi:hypothetical protein